MSLYLKLQSEFGVQLSNLPVDGKDYDGNTGIQLSWSHVAL